MLIIALYYIIILNILYYIILHYIVRIVDCFVYVLLPCVPCDPVAPVWLVFMLSRCLIISLIVLVFKKPQSIQSVFVGPWLSSWVSSLPELPVYPWNIKVICFLDPCLCASLRFVIEGLTKTVNSVSTLPFFSFFCPVFFFFSLCPMDPPSSGPNIFFSCWSRGTESLEEIRDFSCLLLMPPATPDDVFCALYDAQVRWSRGGAAGSNGPRRRPRTVQIGGWGWAGVLTDDSGWRRQERRHFRMSGHWRALSMSG